MPLDSMGANRGSSRFHERVEHGRGGTNRRSPVPSAWLDPREIGVRVDRRSP
jgi:hypothetical protein